ncbi:MAG: 4Fe-4S dicluster domain-containing protein [Myxococcales bacterium]|nr:4Fe-4S dicluster domain-containing protein [Myxococcales bacterium]
MGYLLSTLKSLYATLRQALSKPTTVEFPKVKRERAPRIRASFALTKDAAGDENCIGCKKCEKVCPSEVITVVASKKPSPVTGKARGYADDFTLNLQACIICELCVQVCPTDAIIMVKEQEAPGFSRADLTLTMDKLYKNAETKEKWAWANATVLGEHQKPAEEKKPALAPKPVPAAAAPTPTGAPATATPATAPPATAAPTAPATAAAPATNAATLAAARSPASVSPPPADEKKGGA